MPYGLTFRLLATGPGKGRHMYTYAEELLRMLAAKGVTLDRDGTMVRLQDYTGPQQISDEQIRHHNESRADNETNPKLRCQWVENFAEVVAVLIRDGHKAPWPFASVFWIRL